MAFKIINGFPVYTCQSESSTLDCNPIGNDTIDDDDDPIAK